MLCTSLLLVLLVAPPLQLKSEHAAGAAVPVAARALKPLYHVDGTYPGDCLGYSMCVLPDLDADGVADILVGLPNRDVPVSTLGHAWVVSGATGAMLREHFGTNYGDRFGRRVSVFPDLDGDGVVEYAVGATWAVDPPNGYGADHPGTTTILSGATGAELMVLGGFASGECFGGGLAPLNDVTGDGKPDFAIGSRFGGALHAEPLTAPGKLRIFSSATFQPVHEITGSFPGDYLAGEATTAIGDQDGDGAIDVASGAWAWPYNAKQGEVFVISSATGAVIRTLQGEALGDRYGWALAALPDLDADGHADMLVGAPFAGSAEQGRAYVVSPSAGTVLAVLQGQQAGEQFGSALAAVGDQDGDGVVDYVVGAPGHAQGRGRADLLSGATGKVLASLAGSGPHEELGFAVAALPDLNGDGQPEIGISAIGWPADEAFGRMSVVTYFK